MIKITRFVGVCPNTDPIRRKPAKMWRRGSVMIVHDSICRTVFDGGYLSKVIVDSPVYLR